MKFILLLACGFVFFKANGQTSVDDSLLYELASRTIGDFQKIGNEKLNILRYVTIPTEIWDKQSKTPKTGAYFSADDLESIAKQIHNPAIKTWDVKAISKKRNTKFVAKIGKRDCLVISLPIVSQDGQSVVIYYQSLNKHSGAGFVAVWRKTSQGTWTKDKESMLWITRLKETDSQTNESKMGARLPGNHDVIKAFAL